MPCGCDWIKVRHGDASRCGRIRGATQEVRLVRRKQSTRREPFTSKSPARPGVPAIRETWATVEHACRCRPGTPQWAIIMCANPGDGGADACVACAHGCRCAARHAEIWRMPYVRVLFPLAAVMAQVRRPVPFRTRKLRPGTAMVLHSTGCGRVARRRITTSRSPEGSSTAPQRGFTICRMSHNAGEKWTSPVIPTIDVVTMGSYEREHHANHRPPWSKTVPCRTAGRDAARCNGHFRSHRSGASDS